MFPMCTNVLKKQLGKKIHTLLFSPQTRMSHQHCKEMCNLDRDRADSNAVKININFNFLKGNCFP